jgi:hypothetical protein
LPKVISSSLSVHTPTTTSDLETIPDFFPESLVPTVTPLQSSAIAQNRPQSPESNSTVIAQNHPQAPVHNSTVIAQNHPQAPVQSENIDGGTVFKMVNLLLERQQIVQPVDKDVEIQRLQNERYKMTLDHNIESKKLDSKNKEICSKDKNFEIENSSKDKRFELTMQSRDKKLELELGVKYKRETELLATKRKNEDEDEYVESFQRSEHRKTVRILMILQHHLVVCFILLLT